jgi:two-component system response regulator HydG
MARILCVDDELPLVTLKCAILQSAGHTVTAATSARAAVEKLRDNDYDAVVTDWRLGDADGRVVVEAARNKSNGAAIPVVVVTAYPDLALQAPEPEADLYLEKPVDPNELIIIVNELLKQRGK